VGQLETIIFNDNRFVLYADKENGCAKPFLADASTGRLRHGWPG